MFATHTKSPRKRGVILGIAVVSAALVVAPAVSANADAPTYPSTTTPPNLVTLLQGYSSYYLSDGQPDLHGTIKNAAVLERDDELTVWINQHATKAQKFQALQDAEYNTSATGPNYDQSMTAATGLGSILAKAYIKGRLNGKLPLTTALINSSNGTTGAYVGTGTAKVAFNHPRPYLPSDPNTPAVAGDSTDCAPSTWNASSQQALRVSRSYADSNGNLDITRVPAVTDTTHVFSPNDVTLDAGYGTKGICQGGSFPSGHTTTAYETGFTLATLLPELAPEVLARASEGGNNRIVLGVHYPLDIMGGRIDGEAALAARWSDTAFRTDVLEPARAELLSYFKTATGHSLAYNIAHEKAYKSNPYNGKKIPGGTAQIVTNRKSALKVYTERLTYGFPQVGTKGLAASVPDGASNLLLTAFPSLSDAQRTSILAQTEIKSGYPLDQTGSTDGSWERLNVAAALSATVKLQSDNTVKVTSVGGAARVLIAKTHKKSRNTAI